MVLVWEGDGGDYLGITIHTILKRPWNHEGSVDICLVVVELVFCETFFVGEECYGSRKLIGESGRAKRENTSEAGVENFMIVIY
jgi:hypothetical protein